MIRNVAIFITILIFFKPIHTIAATTTSPVNIIQTAANTSSLTIAWDKVNGAVSYGVRYSDDKNKLIDSNEIFVNTESIKLIYDLIPGTTYYVQVRTYINNNVYSNWSNPVEVNTSPEKITSISQVEAFNDGFTIQWSQVPGAIYDIYLGDSNSISTAILHSQTETNSISFTGMEQNTCKYIFIVPYRTSPNSSFKAFDLQSGAIISCSTIPTAPVKFEVTHRSRNKQTTFSWIPTSKIANTDGYELEIRNSINKRIKTINVKNALDDNKKLKSVVYANSKLFNEPFQYSIRTYIELDNGKKYYSNWSETKKYIPGAYIKKSTFDKKNTCRLNWKKVKGAKSYTIYWSTDGEHWKVIAKYVTGSTAVVKYNKSSKNNYYYVRSINVKFGKKSVNGPSPNNSADIWVFR